MWTHLPLESTEREIEMSFVQACCCPEPLFLLSGCWSQNKIQDRRQKNRVADVETQVLGRHCRTITIDGVCWGGGLSPRDVGRVWVPSRASSHSFSLPKGINTVRSSGDGGGCSFKSKGLALLGLHLLELPLNSGSAVSLLKKCWHEGLGQGALREHMGYSE